MKRLLLIIKAGVSIGLIAVLLTRTDLAKTGQVLRTGALELFVAAFALIWLTHLAQVMRWHYLMLAAGKKYSLVDYVRTLTRNNQDSVRFGQLFRFHLIANFWQLFLPSSAGADVVKGYLSVRHGGLGAVSVSSIIVGRVLGVACILGLALTALVFVDDPATRTQIMRNPVLLALIALCAAGAAALMFQKKLRTLRNPLFARVTALRIWPSLRTVAASFVGYSRHPEALAGGLLISVVVYACMILTSYAVFAGLGWTADPALFTIYVPVIYLLTTLPISFNGIGFREALFAFFLGEHGCTSEHIAGYAVVGYTMILLVGIVGGLIGLANKKAVQEMTHAAPPPSPT